MDWFFLSLMGALTALLVVAAAAFLLRRVMVNWMVDGAMTRLLKDPYHENLWDLVVGMTRVPPHILMEVELRAETGKMLYRPLGTVRRLPDFAGITFNHAQLIRPPLGPEESVDLTTVIGPRASRPMRLQTPILLGALAYGVALGKPFVQALAMGASQAGTAYNAGSGPVPDEVLEASQHLIMQYSGGAWNRDEALLAQADMVEVRYGHGARASTGRVIEASQLPAEAKQLMGLKQGEKAVMEVPIPGAATPAELSTLVPRLRKLIDGGPVGVKLAATHDLEQELQAVLDAGVDVIAIDGAQGSTHGSPPILADDFGIPTVHALHRAVQFLERTGARKDVTLIISGGLRTPGEFLKALAMGADAVYVGLAAVMATTHGQISKASPFEPITTISWANGGRADQFDAQKGAETLANFLTSCAEELSEGLRALGKRSLGEVNRSDLIALDRETAAALGLSPSWRPGAKQGGQSGAGSALGPGGAAPWEPPAAARRPRNR